MNDLTAIDGKPNGFLMTPRDFDQAMEMCRLMAESSVIPSAYKGKPGDIFAACQMGAEVGISPMQSLQSIAVINGRPSLWGDAILGVIQRHPGYAGHEERNTTEALSCGGGLCTIRRVENHTGKIMEFVGSFTVEEATASGLWGKTGPWTQYPGRMLQLRARAFAARDAFADALRGLSVAEEVKDYEVLRTDDPNVDVLMPRRIDGSTARAAHRGNDAPPKQSAPKRTTHPPQRSSAPEYLVVLIQTKDGAKGEYHRITLENAAGTRETFNSFSSTVADAATELLGQKARVEFKKSGQYHNIVGIEPAPNGSSVPADEPVADSEHAPW